MIFWQLYVSFFKIGLFGFGGGYAMLSLIQNETVVRHEWLSDSAFADIVAISQVTPGPISINIATYLGYTVTNTIWGSVIATLAVCTPSVVIMLVISVIYDKLKDNTYVKQVMKSLIPIVIGLILSAFFVLCTKNNFIDYKSYIIFVAALVLSLYKMHPMLLIVLAGVAGLILY